MSIGEENLFGGRIFTPVRQATFDVEHFSLFYTFNIVMYDR